MMKIGIDTGGTFTDFVWLDAGGRLHIFKERSTPDDPSRSILHGLVAMAVPEETAVIHGSTVATNAILERRGARTALITTRGFGDVLAIGRQNRPDIYALVARKAAPLIPDRWRFEVSERVSAEGEILTPLQESDLEPILAAIAGEAIESVAVCLLFSYLRPDHERQIAAVLQAGAAGTEPGERPLYLSLSTEILPEYREYERTATTVLNAYVAPLMSRYLRRLDRQIGRRSLSIMQSNGGLISAATAGAQAARTALSGPAGGVVGARFIAGQAGFDHIITFDMGGTSTDVALCPGRLPTTSHGEIAGLPLRLPIIDIHTVGAGGGSLASVDAGGALQVGPESAGADPGPACYPRPAVVPGKRDDPAGDRLSRVTVTDANLVLGRLDADHFLGGQMRLNRAAARAALAGLAANMKVSSPEAAAWGVIQVANAHMERAIRKISVERGFDPRAFTLIPFGGAGPLHACELAANLRIPRVLIPPIPGVLSALGMLVADPAKDYSQTILRTLSASDQITTPWLAAHFAPLRERALAEMAAEGHDTGSLALQLGVDMRYRGQSHELALRLNEPEEPGPGLAALFHEAHRRRYGYVLEAEAVELVTIRLLAERPGTPPALPLLEPAGDPVSAAEIGRKAAWFDGRATETRLYDRERLRPGHRIGGPAVVFQYDTTTVIPPGWTGEIDRLGNLLLAIVT